MYPPAPPVPVYLPAKPAAVAAEIKVEDAYVKIEESNATAAPPQESESSDIEIKSGVDNHSSAKAKILPVNVNVTANAGVKLIVEALNNLLRKGLLPGGLLGGGDGTNPPASVALPPTSSGAQPSGSSKAKDILVDVDVAVDVADGVKSTKHITQKGGTTAAGDSNISPEEMKKVEDKLAKLIEEIKNNPVTDAAGNSREGLIDELLGLPRATVESVLKKLLPGLEKGRK